jgi:hypothetical protein
VISAFLFLNHNFDLGHHLDAREAGVVGEGQDDVSGLEGGGRDVGGGDAMGFEAGAGKETVQAWKMSWFMMSRSALVRAQRTAMERGPSRGGREPRRGCRRRRSMRGHDRRIRTPWQGMGG